MRNPEAYPGFPSVQYRTSALSTFFKYGGLVAIVGIGCGTGVAMRGLAMVDGKVGHAIKFATQALTDLPAELKGIAPILADATKDRRDPAYAEQLVVKGSVSMPDESDDEVNSSRPGRRYRTQAPTSRALVSITNNGKEVVSVMAIRLVAYDDQDRPLHDKTVYAATPLAIEDEWSGPIMPGSTRKVVVRCDPRATKIDTEVSELRVWDPSIETAPRKVAIRVDD